MSGAVAAPPSVRCVTRPSCGRSLLRCCPCGPELWEGALGAVGGALGVLPGSSRVLPGTGRPLPSRTWYVSSRRRGVGGGTRRVARVVWRVAGHRSAVATSYVVRFFTPSECGRGDSACCRAHPGCCRIVVGRFPCRPGCYPRRLAHVISSAGVGRARRAELLARSRSNERAGRAPGRRARPNIR